MIQFRTLPSLLFSFTLKQINKYIDVCNYLPNQVQKVRNLEPQTPKTYVHKLLRTSIMNTTIVLNNTGKEKVFLLCRISITECNVQSLATHDSQCECFFFNNTGGLMMKLFRAQIFVGLKYEHTKQFQLISQKLFCLQTNH